MRTHAAALVVAALAWATLSGCDKPDPVAESPDAMLLPKVTSVAANGNARSADSATPSLPVAATAAAPKAGDLDAAPAAACGDAPLAPCPLYAWMKSNAGPAAGRADADPATLAAVLDTIARFAPAGYPNWVSIAKDGAAAARAGQGDAAKASCRGCHTQYKAKYKTEMRSRALPPA